MTHDSSMNNTPPTMSSRGEGGRPDQSAASSSSFSMQPHAIRRVHSSGLRWLLSFAHVLTPFTPRAPNLRAGSPAVLIISRTHRKPLA